MKKIRSCRGVETTLSRGRIFTIFAIPLKNIVMSDLEIIRERFLQQELTVDARRAFEALKNASENHLRAFRKFVSD